MRFDLRRPCPECPFTTGPRAVRGLHPARVRELAEGARSWQGQTFACHKTVDYSRTDEDGHTPGGPREQHCAGALIFSIAGGYSTQMMRIAERLRLFNPDALLEDPAVVRSVYGSVEEMIRGHEIMVPPQREEARSIVVKPV